MPTQQRVHGKCTSYRGKMLLLVCYKVIFDLPKEKSFLETTGPPLSGLSVQFVK
jgi:hypothetical protein